MVDSNIISDGSLRNFLLGSHFNRCKRIHPIAALSFKILHFKSFLRWYNQTTHENKIEYNELLELLERDEKSLDTSESTVNLLEDILQKYDIYYNETLSGGHGCTPKFVLTYVQIIDLFHLFERALRTSDLNLYIEAGNNLCALFFIFKIDLALIFSHPLTNVPHIYICNDFLMC